MLRNKVILVGRLTKDITVRKTANGDSVTSFSLAISEGKDSQGNDKAIFVNCNAWKGTADILAQYCRKGDRIGIEGRLTQRRWEEKEVTLTEVTVEGIEFLQSRPAQQETVQPQRMEVPSNPTAPILNITSDDLPF